MVGQLNPVSNAQTSNNKSYYSNISSNVLTDTNMVHTSWVLAIILSLASPQVYTILSCCWMKCHKRTNKKKTDGNEAENTNEDSNNNDDKRRRCKDWVLIVSSSMHQFSSFLFNSRIKQLNIFNLFRFFKTVILFPFLHYHFCTQVALFSNKLFKSLSDNTTYLR